MEYREYGRWASDGREYVITDRKTPRHWYNYYFNDSYNAFASQVGFGEGFAHKADVISAIKFHQKFPIDWKVPELPRSFSVLTSVRSTKLRITTKIRRTKRFLYW